MKTVWQQEGEQRQMAAPLSLIITAFAPVRDVRSVLTPQLRTDLGDTDLILIDLGKGHNRLGASALSQVYEQLGHVGADLDDPDMLRRCFDAVQDLNQEGLLLAAHDRSDGGLITTLLEMTFAGRCGLDIDIDSVEGDAVGVLFNEELGVVLQVRHRDCDDVLKTLEDAELGHHAYVLGSTRDDEVIRISQGSEVVLERSRGELQQIWSETTLHMQRLRDNPQCAEEEFEEIIADNPGLSAKLSFDPEEDIAAPYLEISRPPVAILREQGVNGQQEMAYAFHKAGFEAVDVHMSDILNGAVDLASFKGLVACGGFSYGDVLGAGEGWAKSILFHSRAREQFQAFFEREDTFGLGICNGCQMLSNIKQLIPGATHWPHFVRNRSEQFEARVAMVEVLDSPSVLLQGMQGSRMPIAVAHGEGRAEYRGNAQPGVGVSLRFIDNHGQVAAKYPANPNGSPDGITGLTTDDGRVTIMMPHPERVIRAVQNSWRPDDWEEDSPWMRLFRNARAWVN